MARAARSVTRYSRFLKEAGAERVLDYGAGTLRNALYLVRHGFAVYAADLPDQVEKARRCPSATSLAGVLEVGELPQSRLEVDVVVSTYVFNIIAGTDQRRYLENVVQNLRDGGFLLMEVRCRNSVVRCSGSCSRFLKCAGCAKTYTHDELDRLIAPYGFKRIGHYYREHAVTALYRKAAIQRP